MLTMFLRLIVLGQWLILFSGMATADIHPPVTRLAPRAQPLEQRADFIGWGLQSDGGYDAEFCYSGSTVTTISNMVDCCTTDSASACEFATGCSSRYILRTVLTTAQSSRANDCAWFVTGQTCKRGYLYFGPDNWEAGNFTMYNCGGPLPNPREFYRTLTPGATTSVTLPTIDVPKATLVWGASPPAAPASTTSSPSPTASGSFTGIVSGTGNRDTSTTRDGGLASSTRPGSPTKTQPDGQNSDSGSSSDSESESLSRSDKIAIGIGLGVGLPTVIIAVLAWFWPRQWLAQRKAQAFAPIAVAAPAPVSYSGAEGPMAPTGPRIWEAHPMHP